MAIFSCRLPRPAWMSLFDFTTGKNIPTLGLGVAFALLAGLTTPAFSILLGEIFNAFTKFGGGEISGEALIQKVSTFCLGLVGLGVAGWICSGLYSILFLIFGELQAANVRNKLFEDLLRKDQQWFETQEDGVRTFLSCLQTQVQELQMATSHPLGLVLQYSFRTLASLGLAFYTSWNLSLVILAAIPVFSAIASFLSSKMGASIEEQKTELKRASKVVNNAAISIDAVKCSNAQSFELRSFDTRINKAASHFLRQARLSSLQIALSRFMMFGMFVQGFWYGSTLVNSGRLSAGDVLRTFWACSSAAQSIELLLPQMIVLEKGKVATSALQKVLKDRRNDNVSKEMQGALYPIHCEGDIEVSNVSFCYSSQPNRQILDSTSFFFPAGSTTFVIGESGSGKSTLGQLLARFYLPTSGEISIDGIPIETLSTSWIRNNITLVEQGSILFNESILKNIAFGCRDYENIRKTDVLNCIDLAMLQSTIDNLPDGIETCVGDGGNFLSGGQRQRVAIARARLRDTPILIMDEPTSALDGKNCVAVINSIREWRQGRTTIIVTHDMSQIRDNDFVYILDKGSVTQAGYNHELKVDQIDGRISYMSINDLSSGAIDTDSDNELAGINEPPSKTLSTTFLPNRYGKRTGMLFRDTYMRSPAALYSSATFNIPMDELSYIQTKDSSRNPQQFQDDQSEKSDNQHLIKHRGKRNTDHDQLSKHHHIPLHRAMQTLLPSLTSKQKLLLLLGCLCALAHSTATPLFSYFLSRLLESFYNNGSSGMQWALAVLGVAVCDACVSFSMYFLLELCGQAWVDRLRKRAFQRVLDQDRAWFSDERNSPTHLSTCLYESGEEVRNLVGRFGGFILIAVFVTLLAIIWSVVVCWRLTLVALACGPVIYAIMRGFERTSGVWDRRCLEARTAISGIFVETFAEIRTVRVLTLESYFHRKFLKAALRCMAMGIRKAAYVGLLFGLAECTIIFVSALIFYYGATLVSSEVSTVQNVMMVFSVLLFSIGYASSVVSCIPQISTSREMASQLLRLANLPEHASHEHLGGLVVSRAAPVKITKLNFRYPSRPDALALRNISINIPEGACTALVGLSGSGKSTIASLLLSLYDAQPSTIFLGGVDIRDLHKPSLRSLVSIVSQQPSIFPGTIYANIAYGLKHESPLSSLHNVHTAAKAAVIDEFIESLPRGYFTLIGDGGVGISGGQAQRLMIARALARQPQILILDEATSSLDPASAGKVKETVQSLVASRLGLTVLIITHAKEMMKIADNVIVLEQGSVIENGSYETLLKKPNGRLKDLVRKQTTDEGR